MALGNLFFAKSEGGWFEDKTRNLPDLTYHENPTLMPDSVRAHRKINVAI
jgi:hypothetical protein